MRCSRAFIHLDHLRHNLSAMRDCIDAKTKMCLAVKANAYGHGAVEISREAVSFGVDYLAVATAAEGLELRAAGIDTPILLLIPPPKVEIPAILENHISSVVIDTGKIGIFQHAARKIGIKANLHLKIDTGMGRIGCNPRASKDLALYIERAAELTLEGVCTHFAAADNALSDFTREQITLFDGCLSSIRDAGIEPGIIHAANSGAMLAFPQARYDMVRPGILAYGYMPSDSMANSIGVRPLMELRSKIIQIKKVSAGTPLSYGLTYITARDTHIGTVAIGYADGYNRGLSNRGSALISGRRYPVVGTVCMDQLLIDLGETLRVTEDDEVTLFGPDCGAPDAAEIARLTGTIPYEVICGIDSRVPREYLNPSPFRARGTPDSE